MSSVKLIVGRTTSFHLLVVLFGDKGFCGINAHYLCYSIFSCKSITNQKEKKEEGYKEIKYE